MLTSTDTDNTGVRYHGHHAGVWVQIDAPVAQLRSGAELMYYGGDITELMLAVALLLSVHQRRRQPCPVGPARTAGPRQAARRPKDA